MENKKYIDKVIEHLVRGTKIDYEEDFISYPFSTIFFSLRSFSSPPNSSLFLSPIIPSSFSNYCKNQFGLTEDEIKYVWNEYITIIKDKIKNGK